jgi:outer membrane protein OmpA-like peptidoglycan-associated protein
MFSILGMVLAYAGDRPLPEPVIIAEEPEPEPEPVIIAVEPEPEPVIIAEEPEPEPEPVIIAEEPEPEPEPVILAEEPEPEPVLIAVEPEPEPEPEPVIIAVEPEPVLAPVEPEPPAFTMPMVTINFPPDSVELTEEAKARLREAAPLLLRYPERKIRVGGHTTMAGNVWGRRQISYARARRVADYLIELSVRAAEDIIVWGHGGGLPVESNDTYAGRAANRRVEIILED